MRTIYNLLVSQSDDSVYSPRADHLKPLSSHILTQPGNLESIAENKHDVFSVAISCRKQVQQRKSRFRDVLSVTKRTSGKVCQQKHAGIMLLACKKLFNLTV